MITELQKKTCQSIVNVFETSQARGDYGKVTLLREDSGHLTYGRSQTTLASGNLFLLIKAYCENPDAQFGADLSPYLQRLLGRDLSLDHDETLRLLLRRAGEDPVMQLTQDRFFDRVYWEPAARAAGSLGFRLPLSLAVVYDSKVHGSWGKVRDRTSAALPGPARGEREWVARYVEIRRQWLASSSSHLLRHTVYRMDCFRTLLGRGAWDLALPLQVRGVAITEEILEPEIPRVSACDPAQRLLRLEQPPQQGPDVMELQTALIAQGFNLKADGIFGPATEQAVRQFQARRGLIADGIAGCSTCSALGID